jgi:hypothetical protein
MAAALEIMAARAVHLPCLGLVQHSFQLAEVLVVLTEVMEELAELFY